MSYLRPIALPGGSLAHSTSFACPGCHQCFTLGLVIAPTQPEDCACSTSCYLVFLSTLGLPFPLVAGSRTARPTLPRVPQEQATHCDRHKCPSAGSERLQSTLKCHAVWRTPGAPSHGVLAWYLRQGCRSQGQTSAISSAPVQFQDFATPILLLCGVFSQTPSHPLQCQPHRLPKIALQWLARRFSVGPRLILPGTAYQASPHTPRAPK